MDEAPSSTGGKGAAEAKADGVHMGNLPGLVRNPSESKPPVVITVAPV